MKAARFYDKGDIRVETIPDPPVPASDEVQVDVHWAGICGSDLHEYIAGPMVINTHSRPHPLTGGTIPVTMGHEFCGRIRDAGSSGLKAGQPVMVDPRIHCGTCENCSEGNDHMCESWGFVGLNGGGGGGAGFSERVNVKAKMVYPLADGVDLNCAAVIEPLAVARHALSASGVGDFQGKNVLVVGGGPVGVAVLYNLRAKGVGRVFVSEPTARRSEMVKELGLLNESDVFNPLLVSVPQKCREATGNRGVDVVFDCAGIDKGLVAGLDALRSTGTYVNVAGWETPVSPKPFPPVENANHSVRCSTDARYA